MIQSVIRCLPCICYTVVCPFWIPWDYFVLGGSGDIDLFDNLLFASCCCLAPFDKNDRDIYTDLSKNCCIYDLPYLIYKRIDLRERRYLIQSFRDYKFSPSVETFIRQNPNDFLNKLVDKKLPIQYALEYNMSDHIIKLILQLMNKYTFQQAGLIDGDFPLKLALQNNYSDEILCLIIDNSDINLISDIKEKYTFDIEYESGEYEIGVPKERIQFTNNNFNFKISEGLKVNVKVNKNSYPGKILKDDRGDGVLKFHAAITAIDMSNCSLEVLTRILNKSTNIDLVNTMDSRELFLIHAALCNQYLSKEVLFHIISKTNSETMSRMDFNKTLLIHIAITSKCPIDLLTLIIHKTKINVEMMNEMGLKGNLPIHMAIACYCSIEVVELLMNSFPEAVLVPDEEGKIAIHKLIFKRDYIHYVPMLLSKLKHEQVNFKDSYGLLPVSYAILTNQPSHIIDSLSPTNCSISEEVKSRLYVLSGSFFESREQVKLWKNPNWKLLIFISSTFTDTHAERDILQNEIYPQLKKYSQGIEVTLIDMRWGVKDENTNKHETWVSCQRELQRCKEESLGLYFLSLQGNKYGYNPLPKFIPVESFDDRFNNYSGKEADKILAKEWYQLDLNNCPPRYVLKDLTGDKQLDKEYWEHVLPELREYFSDVEFDNINEESLLIKRSVTEYETRYALSEKSSISRCYWIHRNIKDIDENTPSDLCDIKAPSEKENIDNLKQWMRLSLGKENTKSYEVCINNFVKEKFENKKGKIVKSKRMTISSDSEYIQSFKVDTLSLLKSKLADVIELKKEWMKDGCGLGIDGDSLQEILSHSEFALEKCKDFFGRKELLEKALNMIRISENTQVGLSLSLIGRSGTGKTCFMAKLAEKVFEENRSIPVIIRFCGTTSRSVSGLLMLQSICRHIQFIYGICRNEIPEQYFQLVEHFHYLLKIYPVILILDSLDQLNDDNKERSQLSFLQNIPIHQDSRIIVSTIPDDSDYNYGCDSILMRMKIPRLIVEALHKNNNEVQPTQLLTLPILKRDAPVFPVDPSSTESGEMCLMLNHLISKQSRSLTNIQLKSAEDCILKEPTALYVKLASRYLSNLTSFDNKFDLVPGVKLLVKKIFNEIAINYGNILSRTAIGLITLSVQGIRDNEMIDLLSLDDSVMEEVNAYNFAPSIPPHVWLRLKGEMKGLVAERENNCVRWYHRQVQEAATEWMNDDKISKPNVTGKYCKACAQLYYSCNNSKPSESYCFYCSIYNNLSSYFGNYIDEEILLTKNLAIQPLTFNSLKAWESETHKINYRRCIETTIPLILTNSFVLAINVLCDFEFIIACTKIGQVYSTIIDRLNQVKLKLNNITNNNSDNNNVTLKKKVHDYLDWLNRSVTIIIKSSDYYDVITDAMLNLQYSSVVRRELRYSDFFSFGTRNYATTLVNCAHTEVIYSLCFSRDETRMITGSKDWTVKVWDMNCFAEIRCLNGHVGAVYSVCISPDGLKILSASEDTTIIVTSMRTFKQLRCLQGHLGPVYSVFIDEYHIISGSSDKTVRLWDLRTLTENKFFRGHSDLVTSVCGSPDGSKIFSASLDATVRVWDVRTLSEIKCLIGHTDWISSLCINREGTLLFSGSMDHTVRVWDIKSLSEMKCLIGHENEIYSLTINNNGSRLFSGSADQTLRVWDLESFSEIEPLRSVVENISRCVCISSDSKIIWADATSLKLRTINENDEYPDYRKTNPGNESTITTNQSGWKSNTSYASCCAWTSFS